MKHILIVEDDDAVRALLVRGLRAEYKVTEAASADIALGILQTTGAPDLIVCDVMMPGITGTDFIRLLKTRAQYKTVPVIFLTAKTGPMDVIAGINAGARHYV